MKINLLLITTFISVIIFAGINFETGLVGLTRLNGNGCECHGIEPSVSVHIWIDGPDTVIVSDTVAFKILMTGGPAVEGGYNVAAIYGALVAVDSLSQTMVYLDTLPLQLTHTMPNPFINDTVVWDFNYSAPDSIVVDTIYSVANSVNGDGIPFDDQWNFGANFPVVIIDNPVTVEDEISPVQFHLSQNYPNPFNPSTSIQYTVGTRQFVSLKVYDILGNEVATLVNEELAAGSYEVEFKSTGLIHQTLPSGIYFYRLQTGNFVETKKNVDDQMMASFDLPDGSLV